MNFTAQIWKSTKAQHEDWWINKKRAGNTRTTCLRSKRLVISVPRATNWRTLSIPRGLTWFNQKKVRLITIWRKRVLLNSMIRLWTKTSWSTKLLPRCAPQPPRMSVENCQARKRKNVVLNWLRDWQSALLLAFFLLCRISYTGWLVSWRRMSMIQRMYGRHFRTPRLKELCRNIFLARTSVWLTPIVIISLSLRLRCLWSEARATEH